MPNQRHHIPDNLSNLKNQLFYIFFAALLTLLQFSGNVYFAAIGIAVILFIKPSTLLPLLLLTPVIETRFIAMPGMSLSLLFAFLILILIVLFNSRRLCHLEHDRWAYTLYAYLLVSVIGMAHGMAFFLPDRMYLDAFFTNLRSVLPMILIAVLLYGYYRTYSIYQMIRAIAITSYCVTYSLIGILLFNIFRGSEAVGLTRLSMEGQDPNEYICMLAATVPFILALPFIKKNSINLASVSLCIGLIMYSTMQTLSRGGLLTLAFTFLAHIYIFARKSIGYVVILILLATASIYTLNNFGLLDIKAYEQRYFGKQSTYGTINTAGRDEIFVAGIQAFLAEPVLGYGRTHRTREVAFFSAFGEGRAAHNTYLEILLAYGTIGLIAFMGVLWCACSPLVKLNTNQIPKRFNLLYLPIISLLSTLFTGLHLSWDNRNLMWYLIGTSLASSLLLNRANKIRRANPTGA